ncbi:MAG: hypothetical protein GY847_00540 [Proteobacteria bacterium]|nr:hypothetical protein [Pseudomonadota bacterium]
MNTTIRLKLTIVSFALLSFLLSGCGRAFLVSAIPMAKKASKKLQEYDDPKILEESLPSTLIMYEGFLGVAPDARELLVMTSANYGTYAMSFVEDVDPKQAAKLYTRGKELGMRALMLNHVFADAVKKGCSKKFKSVLWVFKKRDIEALYVTANNWLSWIRLNSDNPRALKDLPKVEALMHRVLELNENYYHGAIHASFGVYYGSLGKAKGGKPEKAKQHFAKAFEISGSKALFFHFLYAKTYAIQIQDKKLFISTLKKVLAAPSNRAVEMTMANQIAKLKARRLLDDVDKYFL